MSLTRAIPPTPGFPSPLRTSSYRAAEQRLLAKGFRVPLLEKLTTPRLMTVREMGAGRPGPLSRRILLRKKAFSEQFRLHSKIWGHLTPVYCVKFDQTGRYIFTGADDHLIKVSSLHFFFTLSPITQYSPCLQLWDSRTGLLRFTFRGHSEPITDMAVSHENTLLASGSLDKTVRVWCLRRGGTVFVYRAHTAMITTIMFVPYAGEGDADDVRWMAWGSSDCHVVFLRYRLNTMEFGDQFKFSERSTPGRKILSSCHSPGGTLVAMGDSHHAQSHIRLFRLTATSVERLYELSAHTDKIDSLVWAHDSLRFASGSKDGKAKVWAMQAGEQWKATELVVSGGQFVGF